jgi:hypothetical protein
LRDVQSDPAIAKDFLINAKIPHIYSNYSDKKIYVETSHFFCKGFFEAWVSLDDVPLPELIILNRNPRQVALSMYQLSTIPQRTKSGLKYYLSPTDKMNYTRLRNWNEMNNYQLCYWYCLEIEERKKIYSDYIRQKGGLVATTSIDELKKFRGFFALKKALQLPHISMSEFLKYFFLRMYPQNKKNYAKKNPTKYSSRELDAFEEEVREQTYRTDNAL